MRPVTPAELDLAARALVAMPMNLRYDTVMAWLWKADVADRYRKRYGRCLPLWGNGSLGAIILRDQTPTTALWSGEVYEECLRTTLDALGTWRRRGDKDL